MPSEVKELSTWSVEGLFQFLYANTVDAKKIEANRKSQENKTKIK
jgi:hypothetical protein